MIKPNLGCLYSGLEWDTRILYLGFKDGLAEFDTLDFKLKRILKTRNFVY